MQLLPICYGIRGKITREKQMSPTLKLLKISMFLYLTNFGIQKALMQEHGFLVELMGRTLPVLR